MPVAGLRRLAEAGGGAFAELSVDNSDLARLSLQARAGATTRSEEGGQSIERWLDRGPWLAVLLLPLVALAFRRGGYVLAGCLVLVAGAPRGAQAASWDALWKNRDQRGVEALQEGDADRAALLFTDPAWQASAAYRAGDFEGSAAAFSGLDGVTAEYNRATALARAGDIDGAIAGYEALLERQPDHEDARYNLDLLRSMQNEQQQGGQQGGESGDPSDESASGSGAAESGDGQSGSQGGDAGDEQGGSSSPSERRSADNRDAAAEQADIEAIQKALREAEAADGGEPGARVPMTAAERDAAEQQQALEQWLRRIPDDPGGLLRRKFRYQYQRRQTDQDGNQLWPDDRAEPW